MSNTESEHFVIDARTPRADVSARVLTDEDAMAAVFGPLVCHRYLRGEIECPFCGRWARLASPQLGVHDFVCVVCKHSVAVHAVLTNWAVVQLDDLLDVLVTKYYLPRDWNRTNWITREALLEKFATLKKELSDVR